MLPLVRVRPEPADRDLMAARPPVRGARTFAALMSSSHRAREGSVAVRFLPAADRRTASVAYAIPRSVGSAVRRNRLRRQARAVMASLDLAGGAWLVALGPAATGLSYEHLYDTLRQLCEVAAR